MWKASIKDVKTFKTTRRLKTLRKSKFLKKWRRTFKELLEDWRSGFKNPISKENLQSLATPLHSLPQFSKNQNLLNNNRTHNNTKVFFLLSPWTFVGLDWLVRWSILCQIIIRKFYDFFYFLLLLDLVLWLVREKFFGHFKEKILLFAVEKG